MAKEMNTEELLVEWGLWLHNSDRVDLGYSSPALDMVRSNTAQCRVPALPSHDIDEKTAAKVDQLVATLIQHDERKGKSLVMYYSWRKSLRWIADHLDIDKNKVQQLIQNAVSWIDGARYEKF